VKIALIHDWLTGMRGGEKILEIFCRLFPDATIFTLLHNKGSVSPVIEEKEIRTSLIQRLPGAARKYRHYVALFPRAAERFDFTGYDLLLSCSHCAAKGVVPPPGARHVCYCLTPMRYAWDLYDQYFNARNTNPVSRLFINACMRYLRKWDRAASSRVDAFITISNHVADRIHRHYGRQAAVVYPPVDTGFFTPGGQAEDDYLCVSALVPYKRLDLAIEACAKAGRKLRIIGTGTEAARLEKMAGPNVQFEGFVSPEALREAYRRCRALIYPAEEDFGIAPVEAMACGKPVLAFGRGGLRETVIEGETGLFFPSQSADSIADCLRAFEKTAFSAEKIRSRALRFSEDHFVKAFSAALRDVVPEFADTSIPDIEV
jgi:glycosyltransferase involved in cell wall biosynthesis